MVDNAALLAYIEPALDDDMPEMGFEKKFHLARLKWADKRTNGRTCEAGREVEVAARHCASVTQLLWAH